MQVSVACMQGGMVRPVLGDVVGPDVGGVVYLNSAISLYAFVFLKCVCVFLSTERTSEVLLLASV